MFGPCIHLLGKRPQRPVAHEIQQKASSLAAYGVVFHARGNTMKALKWSDKDLLDFATTVSSGVDDIMRLQEKGLFLYQLANQPLSALTLVNSKKGFYTSNHIGRALCLIP